MHGLLSPVEATQQHLVHVCWAWPTSCDWTVYNMCTCCCALLEDPILWGTVATQQLLTSASSTPAVVQHVLMPKHHYVVPASWLCRLRSLSQQLSSADRTAAPGVCISALGCALGCVVGMCCCACWYLHWGRGGRGSFSVFWDVLPAQQRQASHARMPCGVSHHVLGHLWLPCCAGRSSHEVACAISTVTLTQPCTHCRAWHVLCGAN
jgi:hypothetical protein